MNILAWQAHVDENYGNEGNIWYETSCFSGTLIEQFDDFEEAMYLNQEFISVCAEAEGTD